MWWVAMNDNKLNIPKNKLQKQNKLLRSEVKFINLSQSRFYGIPLNLCTSLRLKITVVTGRQFISKIEYISCKHFHPSPCAPLNERLT